MAVLCCWKLRQCCSLEWICAAPGDTMNASEIQRWIRKGFTLVLNNIDFRHKGIARHVHEFLPLTFFLLTHEIVDQKSACRSPCNISRSILSRVCLFRMEIGLLLQPSCFVWDWGILPPNEQLSSKSRKAVWVFTNEMIRLTLRGFHILEMSLSPEKTSDGQVLGGGDLQEYCVFPLTILACRPDPDPESVYKKFVPLSDGTCES